MPGTIVNLQVTQGEQVLAGQVVLILEAMKMETEIQAPISGTVTEVLCKKGDKVTPEQILLRLS